MSTSKPELRAGAYGGAKSYRVDWHAYLDDPKPTERLRARGHRVAVEGDELDDGGYFGQGVHWLDPTSYGAPRPWDSYLVALGPAGPRHGWLYGETARGPFVSNGGGMWLCPAEVVRAMAECETCVELPPESVDLVWSKAEDSVGARVATRALRCVRTPVEDTNVARVGSAFIDARYLYMTMQIGAMFVREAIEPLDAVLFPGFGVVMPMRIGEAS